MTRIRLMALGLLATVACSGSDNTVTGATTGTTIAFDMATMAADATAEDVDIMAGMDGEIGLLTGSAILLEGPTRPGVNGCIFGAGRFNCPPRSHQGLTLDRTVTFLDAAGATQAAYDNQTTASIQISVEIEGTVTRGNWTATVDRQRDLVITGLVGTETTRTVNGTGTESVSGSRHTGNSGNGTSAAARSYDLDGTVTMTNVVIPVRGEGVAPWPLSGTVTRNVTITPTGDGGGTPVTRTIIVTFNGTANVPATVNGEDFTLNLAARNAVRRGK